MNWKRMLLGVGAVILLGGGIYFAYTQFFAAEPEAEDSSVAQATDGSGIPANTSLGVVSAEGNIVPLRDAVLSFQTGGEVLEIIAKKGAVVESGDPILQLDATDQEISLVQCAGGRRDRRSK